MRTNVYRKEIVRLLSKNHLLSISDLNEQIVKADYSTIYRNVRKMTSDGVLRKIVLDKGTVVYEMAEKENEHGHFMCLDCGDLESIQTQSTTDFLPDKCVIHDILVRGLCEKCTIKE